MDKHSNQQLHAPGEVSTVQYCNSYSTVEQAFHDRPQVVALSLCTFRLESALHTRLPPKAQPAAHFSPSRRQRAPPFSSYSTLTGRVSARGVWSSPQLFCSLDRLHLEPMKLSPALVAGRKKKDSARFITRQQTSAKRSPPSSCSPAKKCASDRFGANLLTRIPPAFDYPNI